MANSNALNPTVEASERALAELRSCVDAQQSFLLEAGAGAGKTYSLVHVLRELIERHKTNFPRVGKKIACITFTNVAKDEIEARTDRNAIIHCDTVHGFCWSLIAPFQKQVREIVVTLEPWIKKIAEVEGPLPSVVEYSLGYRSLNERSFSLGHDDVIPIAVSLLERAKFRSLLTARYPIILIDEYQDTNAQWIDAIKKHFIGKPGSPLFGFFGDHWQKIYEDGCGAIQHSSLRVIGKHANFRSVQPIVECLNRMRPQLTQFTKDPNSQGDIQVFHTNTWTATRRTGAHWGGDLPEELAREAFEIARNNLAARGWDFSADQTKILMLTHRSLAREQGYNSLPSIFTFNDAFAKKENKLIEFFVDNLEPAANAFSQKRFGAMFEALGTKVPAIRSHADKKGWSTSMMQLNRLRETGTVGEVVDHLRTVGRPRLPDAVEQMEAQLDELEMPAEGVEIPRWLEELSKLHVVPYKEIIKLRAYLTGYSPFETNHGVKGAEFENVLVVVGRGWSKYNFSEMLELAQSPQAIAPRSVNKFEQNRNLMYVSCSRPKTRLGVLFTQQLSPLALQTARLWFGAERVQPLPQI